MLGVNLSEIQISLFIVDLSVVLWWRIEETLEEGGITMILLKFK